LCGVAEGADVLGPGGEGGGRVRVQVVGDEVGGARGVGGLVVVDDYLEAEGPVEEGVVEWVVEAVGKVNEALLLCPLLVGEVEELPVFLVEAEPVGLPLFGLFVCGEKRGGGN